MKINIDGKKVEVNGEMYIPFKILRRHSFILMPHQRNEMVNEIRNIFYLINDNSISNHGRIRSLIEECVDKYLPVNRDENNEPRAATQSKKRQEFSINY